MKGTAIFLIIFLAIAQISYTSYRAANLSMTCDESSTYLNYHDTNVFTCFSSKDCWGNANNHLLNTFLFQQSVKIFGVNELGMRAPNLLGHIIYLLFSFLLVLSLTRNRLLIVTGFVLLNVNPYLLDFFSLARGYGLNLGFEMAGLYFLVRYVKSREYWSLALCFFSLFL